MACKLADELRSARSADEILAGVALATWVDAHPGAESCPPHHAPGEVDLFRWLPVCPEDAAREAAERLTAAEQRPCDASWQVFCWPKPLHDMLGVSGFPAALLRFTGSGPLPGPDGTTSVLVGKPYAVRRLEHVHAIWAGLPNGSRPSPSADADCGSLARPPGHSSRGDRDSDREQDRHDPPLPDRLHGAPSALDA